MNQESFSFTIYMIHACASAWDKKPSEVYDILQSRDCIDNFLISNYDVLHTQGTAYIVGDIQEYLKVRGIVI